MPGMSKEMSDDGNCQLWAPVALFLIVSVLVAPRPNPVVAKPDCILADAVGGRTLSVSPICIRDVGEEICAAGTREV